MLKLLNKTDGIEKDYTVIYDAIGNEMREYKVNVNENQNEKKTINLDDALLDDFTFPDEYYNFSWDDTPVSAKDEKNISQQEFYNMDFKSQLYFVYRQLLEISSFLSDINEVVIYGTKTK